jgi:N-acetylglucosaminyl-diphospho-decaprenol L-rhamnosyltransferase
VISISIVSHGQGNLVVKLLADLSHLINSAPFEVILTKNIPEKFPFSIDDYPYPVRIIENTAPKGFGANHNAAFRECETQYFCVVNPDILLPEDPFSPMLSCQASMDAAVVAPAVYSSQGITEDNIRHFPSFWRMFQKAAGLSDGSYLNGGEKEPFCADWVGGMFMLFRSEDFRLVSGFDEDFFLYYEDVDICVRLWKAGKNVVACPSVHVIHDAQRASHSNLRHLGWHLSSMVRYIFKHYGRLPKIPND